MSVAQETGEVSADAYTMAYNESGGILPPPNMVGIEDQVEQLRLEEAESNPFAVNGAPPTRPGADTDTYSGAPSPGQQPFRPPAIIPPAPSPSRSMVSQSLCVLPFAMSCMQCCGLPRLAAAHAVLWVPKAHNYMVQGAATGGWRRAVQRAKSQGYETAIVCCINHDARVSLL